MSAFDTRIAASVVRAGLACIRRWTARGVGSASRHPRLGHRSDRLDWRSHSDCALWTLLSPAAAFIYAAAWMALAVIGLLRVDRSEPRHSAGAL
jgi:hypothetical protein